jgi:hypothetical protein
MEKKFIVKDFYNKTYWCGTGNGWLKHDYMSEIFNSIEDAEQFISLNIGKYQIETFYTTNE